MSTIPHVILKDNNVNNHDQIFKLIIIGDSCKSQTNNSTKTFSRYQFLSHYIAVGKSCLLARIMDEEFKVEHQVTIGVEFGSFVIQIDRKIVKLQIWDTAGQESFRSVTRIFYKGAHVVFLCFDLTREDTFNNLRTWLNDIRAHASAEILVYLIGSKLDLVE